mmetsp:Transcript_47947/g.126491  ORF Transcript_47947/g.126491 Transcript_47947/m.126491 type:complete len:241 (+) Transcript_47947:1514-2236(+)
MQALRDDSRESLPIQIPTEAVDNGSKALKTLSAVAPALGPPAQIGEGKELPIETVAKDAGPRRCTSIDPFWKHTDLGPTTVGRENGRGSLLDEGGSLTAGLLAAASPGSTGGALRCLSDVVDAADREQELLVPETDLTMVHMESWEQKLDWRSFLSEAVATSKARQLFTAFDVEADPPPYARPPPSAPTFAAFSSMAPSSSGSSAAGLAGSEAPQRPRGGHSTALGRSLPCVAPAGAGWL